MFTADFTRIDNQSSKGPQGGFYAMALQTNGQQSYTVAKLNVPEALCNLLTMLVMNMNKTEQDKIAYLAAIAQWDDCLTRWVEKIKPSPTEESVC